MKTSVFALFAGLFLMSLNVKSQQLYQYSQYMNRPVLNNPAAAGQHEAICLFAGGRYQWIGYTDQNDDHVYPKNFVGGISMPVYSINSGIGLQFSLEQMGYQSRMDLRLDYAYKIGLKGNQYLALGLNAQISRFTMDISKLTPENSQDPLLFEQGEQSDLIPEAGVGVFYYSPDKWWAGISFLNLVGSNAQLGNVEIKDQPTLVAQGQYRINVIDERFKKFDLAPSLLLKTNFISTQAEIDVLGYFREKYWFGAGYRFQDGAILMAGIHFNNLNAGISYDFTTGQVREATRAGTLELHAGYCIPVYPKVECHSGFNVRHL